MKVFLKLLTVVYTLTGGFTNSHAAANQQEPKRIPSPVEKIFIPHGFDSNDNVEIVLHGHFQSTCYKVGPVSSKVVGQTVEVEAYTYQYEGSDCEKVPVPFIQSVKLGSLLPDNYKVKYRFNENLKAEPLIIVQTLRSEPDDFLYAPVASADLIYKKRTKDYRVVVEGYYPHFFIGCMKIEKVRSYLSPGNVVVVQPIAKMYYDQSCGSEHRYRIETKVDFSVNAEEYLIHARVLDGNSFNQVVEHIF